MNPSIHPSIIRWMDAALCDKPWNWIDRPPYLFNKTLRTACFIATLKSIYLFMFVCFNVGERKKRNGCGACSSFFSYGPIRFIYTKGQQCGGCAAATGDSGSSDKEGLVRLKREAERIKKKEKDCCCCFSCWHLFKKRPRPRAKVPFSFFFFLYCTTTTTTYFFCQRSFLLLHSLHCRPQFIHPSLSYNPLPALTASCCFYAR